MEKRSIVICPNCESEIESDCNFCSNCGQANKKHNLNFKFVVSEFLSANFNLDNKILLTLKELIFSPGKLTHEFMVGRRAKYITPIRLYLLISFVYFFVLSLDFNRDNEFLKTSNNITTNYSDSINDFNLFNNAFNDSISNDTITENSFFDGMEESIEAKAKTINSDTGKLMFKELLRKYTSIGMFVLIPITALLFFWIFNKGTYYYQHLVFSFHLQSVVFLLFVFFNIIEWFADNELITSLKWLLFLLILFLWIKKYFKLSILRTIWKAILFLIGYTIIIVLFFIIVALVSFLNIEGLKS